MPRTNPNVDAFFSDETQWQPHMRKLRRILLSCGLAEELKWSKPCYSVDGHNVVIIQGFKAYCALLFFKGVLMKDPQKILKKTGENTIVGRQIRFTDVQQIAKMESVLKSYIKQAVAIEKAGLKVEVKHEKLVFPEELQIKLDEYPAFKKAFDVLTPGRQRAYNFYFSSAKQSATREARIEKCIPQILKGKGLNE